MKQILYTQKSIYAMTVGTTFPAKPPMIYLEEGLIAGLHKSCCRNHNFSLNRFETSNNHSLTAMANCHVDSDL